MTHLLEQAYAQVAQLPEADQDAIAALILEELHSLQNTVRLRLAAQEPASTKKEQAQKRAVFHAALREAGLVAMRPPMP